MGGIFELAKVLELKCVLYCGSKQCFYYLNVDCFQFLVAHQVVHLNLMSPDVQFLEDSLKRHIPEICFFNPTKLFIDLWTDLRIFL
jgi:hypothetical protein